MVYTKEQKAAYNKAYRAKNTERIAAKKKAYRSINKEGIAAYQKAYRTKSKEEKAAYMKAYYIENKDKMSAGKKVYRKAYSKTPSGIKSLKKGDWKYQGIIYDLNKLHHIYSNTNKCWVCKNKFKSPRDKQVDHDHNITDRDNFRYILCHRCNSNDHFKKHLSANIIIRFFNQM